MADSLMDDISMFFEENTKAEILDEQREIVNMEKLITDMMQWANITEEDLKTKGIIRTAFGEN